jgi:hypothetical protein
MNKQVILSLFLLMVLKGAVVAQECEYLKGYKKGSKIQRSFYDKKGKLDFINDGVIEEVKYGATGWTMTMKALNKDEKGKVKYSGSAEFKCENGVFSGNLLSANDYVSQMTKDSNTTVTTTGDFPQYSNLEVGKPLPDASMEFAIALGGLTLARVKNSTFNRNVTAFEKVTTSAGTFDCYKIESDIEIKLLIRTVKGRFIEYFSKEHGGIKTISYDKKGQETSHSELTLIQL